MGNPADSTALAETEDRICVYRAWRNRQPDPKVWTCAHPTSRHQPPRSLTTGEPPPAVPDYCDIVRHPTNRDPEMCGEEGRHWTKAETPLEPAEQIVLWLRLFDIEHQKILAELDELRRLIALGRLTFGTSPRYALAIIADQKVIQLPLPGNPNTLFAGNDLNSTDDHEASLGG